LFLPLFFFWGGGLINKQLIRETIRNQEKKKGKGNKKVNVKQGGTLSLQSLIGLATTLYLLFVLPSNQKKPNKCKLCLTPQKLETGGFHQMSTLGRHVLPATHNKRTT